MSKIPGKHKIREPQITAILDTAHILRKVIMHSTHKTFNKKEGNK
jgi:hypothetical protein